MMNLDALLIGIEHYESNKYCTSLEGPVADVEAMEEFLRKQEPPCERIRRLVSRHPDQPARPGERPPTYENMIAAIRGLAEEARPGKQVLLYYSGHGGRTPTLIPNAKGRDGIDEGFVPPNIGDPEARYLRDVELSYLVREMAEKGLLITLILDSCHSGSMRRGGLVPRGRRCVDRTERPLDSLVASREELEAEWTRAHGRAFRSRGASRTHESGSGWMPESEGVVVLAACRSFESAYECRFDGQSRGLLTYSLLEILAGGGRDLSFRRIHDLLIGRVHRHCPDQNPVLEGDVSRNIFGARLQDLLAGLRVIEVDESGKRFMVDAGQAIGVGRGAQLRVVAEGEADGPLVEIQDSGAVRSWAVACEGESGLAAIQPGDRAVLVDPGKTFRHRVVLVSPGSGDDPSDGPAARPWWRRVLDTFGEPPAVEDRADTCEALAAVHRAISERASGFLELGDGDGGPAFQVSVVGGAYEIQHAHGRRVPDVSPVPVSGPRAAETVVERLVHLGKFRNVRDLENRVPGSPLLDRLEVELSLLPEDFQLGDPIEPRKLEGQGPVPKIANERWICLEITNRSLQQLEIYVLDLQPGWSIELVHPPSGLETLEGGQTLLLPFEAYLPSEDAEREDPLETLKVFATADPADFRWLELPPIGRRPRTARSSLGDPGDSLEQLFAEIAKDGPRTRRVRTHHASRHWTSAQVRFEVVL